MYTPRQRKANNALGIGVVALMMLSETVIAHHRHPNPLSPTVWSVLGAVALACLVYYALHRRTGERGGA